MFFFFELPLLPIGAQKHKKRPAGKKMARGWLVPRKPIKYTSRSMDCFRVPLGIFDRSSNASKRRPGLSGWLAPPRGLISPRERTQNQAEEAEELESPDRPINAIHFASELVFLLSSTCVTRTRSLTWGLRESPSQGLQRPPMLHP
jgi:hypothetical protein